MTITSVFLSNTPVRNTQEKISFNVKGNNFYSENEKLTEPTAPTEPDVDYFFDKREPFDLCGCCAYYIPFLDSSKINSNNVILPMDVYPTSPTESDEIIPDDEIVMQVPTMPIDDVEDINRFVPLPSIHL